MKIFAGTTLGIGGLVIGLVPVSDDFLGRFFLGVPDRRCGAKPRLGWDMKINSLNELKPLQRQEKNSIPPSLLTIYRIYRGGLCKMFCLSP
ncbi:MAG: hypothetical protein A2X81_09175 [Desulfobacterales bacterium GWB2_56_26]|nr:MAG: hypothetical protein A2X81_09175 [Desulfobacterales bacterium GWB2_56_26]